jgi:hypothetical protein
MSNLVEWRNGNAIHVEAPLEGLNDAPAISPTTLAGFMELRGRRVVEACGVLWHSTAGGFLMSLPYHQRLTPDYEEIDRLTRSQHVVGVRFPSTVWPGLPGGVYLHTAKSYRLSDIHRAFRRKIRRGLEQLRIRCIEPDELLAQGQALNLDTMKRQGRYDPEFGEPSKWKQFVEAVRRCPGVVAVGAFCGDRLAAYMITCREGRGLHILHQMSREQDLARSPNHVLTYEVTRQAAEDTSLDFVSYGLMSLVRTPGLHQYKLQFGYELNPHNEVFQIHPALAPILRSSSARTLVHWVRGLRPQDQRLERLESVLQGASVPNHR